MSDTQPSGEELAKTPPPEESPGLEGPPGGDQASTSSTETDSGLISQNDIDKLLTDAGVDLPSTGDDSPTTPASEPFRLESFQPDPAGTEEGRMDLLLDVDLDVQVILGSTKLSIEDILRLREGSVVELNKLAGDALTILVNNRSIAKGEVLVLDDNFCIRITEIQSPEERTEIGS